MKKLLLLLVLCFAFTATSQLKVQKSSVDTVVWQSKGTTIPKLIKFTTESRVSFTLYYKNAKYSSITDIKYLTIGDLETTKQFFDLLENVLESEEKYTVEIDKTFWIISKQMKSVRVFSEYSYFYLTDKQIAEIKSKL
jgi:hypothetical protein